MGNVRQVTDAQGQLAGTRSYTPWGEVLAQSGQGDLTAGYLGGMLDAATGLIYIGNGQYYDPATGRFLTRDANPSQTNPYVPWKSDPAGAMLAPLALLAMIYGGKKKRGKWDQLIILLVLCGTVGMSLSACGTQPTTVSTPTATATITPMPNQTLQVEATATTVPGTPTATFTLTPTLAPDQHCGSPATPTPEKIEESYKQLAEYAKNNPTYGSNQELANIQSHITSLVNSASAHSLNTNQLAYVLATAQHETLGWTNFVEMCGDEQIPCDPNDNHSFFNRKYNGINGNASVGDDGWAFRGRGYIMLTFKDNYKKVGENIGFPLDAGEGYAEYAYCSRSECSFGASTFAAEIAIVGMKEGLARGTKLKEFDHGNDFDFEGARDIIHADDNARQRIADLGRGFAELLSARCQLGGLPGGVICRCYPVE